MFQLFVFIFWFAWGFFSSEKVYFSFPVAQKLSKKVHFGNTALGCFQTCIGSLHHETKAEEVPSVEEAGLSLLPTAMRCWGVRPAVNAVQQPCCPLQQAVG